MSERSWQNLRTAENLSRSLSVLTVGDFYSQVALTMLVVFYGELRSAKPESSVVILHEPVISNCSFPFWMYFDRDILRRASAELTKLVIAS
jgi:hypothetical protein